MAAGLGRDFSPRLAAGVGRGEIGLKPDLRGAVPMTPLLGLGGDAPPVLAAGFRLYSPPVEGWGGCLWVWF